MKYKKYKVDSVNFKIINRIYLFFYNMKCNLIYI